MWQRLGYTYDTCSERMHEIRTPRFHLTKVMGRLNAIDCTFICYSLEIGGISKTLPEIEAGDYMTYVIIGQK